MCAGPGFCVVDNFLGRPLAEEVSAAVQRLDARGRLRDAAVGRGESKRVDPSVRGDRIMWVDGGIDAADAAGAVPAPVGRLMAKLQQLQSLLCVAAPGLRLCGRTSVQVACYPGTPAAPRHYRRHRDAYPGGHSDGSTEQRKACARRGAVGWRMSSERSRGDVKAPPAT